MLFAGDLLLFITFPITLLPVCKLLDTFANVSGLHVNLSKSQALNVSLQLSVMAQLKHSFRFEWSDSSICFIGINLSPKIECLYQANYQPMHRKLESDLLSWAQYKLSWVGRINSVKMTLLPRLLYLFRSLPILIRRDHIKSFQGKITKFVWGKGGYRFSQCILSHPKSHGGMGLPNLTWYYQAARLAQLSTIYSRLEKPDWTHRETGSADIHSGLPSLVPP